MSDNLAKQTIAELHSLVAITLDLYDRLEELGDELAEARDLDHIALGLFDRIESLGSENARMGESLKKLEYWFDTDQEVLDAMTPDERADHMRQLTLIRDTLTS